MLTLKKTIAKNLCCHIFCQNVLLLTWPKFPPNNHRAQRTLHWDLLSSGRHYLQTHSECLTYGTVEFHHTVSHDRRVHYSAVLYSSNGSSVLSVRSPEAQFGIFICSFSLIKVFVKKKFSWENGPLVQSVWVFSADQHNVFMASNELYIHRMFSAHHGSDLIGVLHKSTCRLLTDNCSAWQNEVACVANGTFIYPRLKVKQLREWKVSQPISFGAEIFWWTS